MPRVKQSKPTKVESQKIDDDAIKVEESAPTFAPGEPEVVEVQPLEPLKVKKPRAPKVKPCSRCEERRKREREYAKTSRLRARIARSDLATKGDAASPESQAAPVDPPAAV